MDAVPDSPPRARILIVDDRESNLKALEALLSPLGHELLFARSGEEALLRLLDHDVALILLDAQMPGLDGFETAAVIKSRRRTRSIPIIFITGLTPGEGQVPKAYAYGAVDFLQKPIDPDILRSKVAAFVDLYLRTEQVKRQEARLREREREALTRESERRYRAVLDTMPLGVWAIRPDGIISFCNRASTDYLGPFSEENPHDATLEAVHPDDAVRVEAERTRGLESGEPFEIEYRMRRRSDGAERWHLLKVVPERDESGALLGWIASAIDIDARRRADEVRAQLLEKELKAREAAEAANRAKDEFLAVVSHELRTPLTAIIGWTAMLRRPNADAERVSRGLQLIERNARLQRELIEDLLDISRIVAGKLELQPSAVDVGSLLETQVEAMRPQAEAAKLEFRFVRPAESLVANADGARLKQVAGNLISNALKFTPEGGKVEVELSREVGALVLEVRDSGCGIAPEFLPFVFDRFRQADGTRSREHSGLGLGLAIVRHLVQLHGGTVEARSDGRGKGSTFRVRLPAAESPAVVEPAPLPVTEPARELAGLRVLLVEDEDDSREVLSELLRSHGALVTPVRDAEAALQAMDEQPFDVLLSDIGLPRVDGFEFIRQVRGRPAEKGGLIPAAALTAFAGAETHQRALAGGFQAHMTKPFDVGSLVTLLTELARQRPTTQALAAG